MKPKPKLITVAEALAGNTNRLPCKPKALRITFIQCPTPRQLARPPSF